MGLLSDFGNRKKMLDEADPTYSATPQTAQVQEEAVSEPSPAPADSSPKLGSEFSITPQKGAIVRMDPEGDARLWSNLSKVWIPVKTYFHEPTKTTYWWDAANKKFYPIVQEGGI